MEECRQETAIILDGVYGMMSERHYCVWMAKGKNGCMEAADASAQWKQFRDQAGAIRDMLGPSPKYKERVAIKKVDLVKFRDSSVKVQSYQLRDKDVKNANQDAIDKAAARLSKGPTFSATSARSRGDMACAMTGALAAATSGGEGGAFSSAGLAAMHIPDVRDLVSEEEGEAAEEESVDGNPETPRKRKREGEETAAGESSSSSKGSRPTKKSKKERWFGRDAAVASALKGHQGWLKTTRRDMNTIITSSQVAIENVTPDVEDEVKNEMKLAKNRLYALRLVMGDRSGDFAEDRPGGVEGCEAPAAARAMAQDGQAKKLEDEPGQENKDKKDGKTEESEEAAADVKKASGTQDETKKSTLDEYVRSAGDQKKALRKYIASYANEEVRPLGQAPPCRSYKALLCFVEFEDKVILIEAAQTKEEIATIQNEMKTFKAAYSDLLSMARAAKGRLENAMNDATKEIAKQQQLASGQEGLATGRGRGRPRKHPAVAPASVLIEQPSVVAIDIPSVVVSNGGKLASEIPVAKPTILRLHTDVMGQFDGIRNIIVALGAKFKNDPSRAEPGRSQRGLPKDAGMDMMATLHGYFPTDHILPSTKIMEKLKDILNPVAFIIAKGRLTTSAEAAHLPTCRLGFVGTRSVVCTPTRSLLEYLSKSGGGAKCDVQRAYHWLKTVTTDAAKTFLEASAEHTIMHATVGPHDVLYIPPGWILFEKIVGNLDFVGVRLQHLSLTDLPELSALSTYLMGLGKPSTNLQMAVDCLALAEA